MGVLKNWLGIPSTLQLFIVKLVGSLAWLSCVALAQMDISETVTSSVSFPDVGITCLTNLAIFITSLLRGRLDLEVAARDVLAIKRGTKLEHIHRFGLTTCENHKYEDASAVLLSYQSPNSSIREFMRYISSAHGVQSILLECLPLRSAALLAEICNCNDTVCKCILFCTVEEITFLLAKRMPGTLKRLTGNLCLLLSRDCLTNGCHGCKQRMLYVDEQKRLREDGKKIEGEAMERSSVLETLDYIYEESVPEKRTCVCIPLHPARKDLWTDHLMRSFRSKDKESRGVRVMASDALENYMALGSQANYMASEIVEAKGVEVRYSSGSLIVPRFIELFLNISLTGWFRTDGFSTAIVARRAVRNYLTDSKGTGFGANSFVIKARVKSSKVQLDNKKVQPDNDDLVDVCQVLTFRGSFVSLRTLSFIGCFVNLGCSFCWALVVAFEGSDGRKWHYTHSMRPSIARVAVIMAALVICLGMDCLHLYLATFPRPIPFKKSSEQNSPISIKTCETSCKGSKFPNRVLIVWAVTVLEILCIVACSTLLGVWGIKHFGRWIYSAMHLLVWVKWGIGSYLLGERLPKYASGPVTTAVCGKEHAKWTDNGILVYSSAFLLNAILAGVRGKWDYVPSPVASPAPSPAPSPVTW